MENGPFGVLVAVHVGKTTELPSFHFHSVKRTSGLNQ